MLACCQLIRAVSKPHVIADLTIHINGLFFICCYNIMIPNKDLTVRVLLHSRVFDEGHMSCIFNQTPEKKKSQT